MKICKQTVFLGFCIALQSVIATAATLSTERTFPTTTSEPTVCENAFSKPVQKITAISKKFEDFNDPATIAQVQLLAEKLIQVNKVRMSDSTYRNTKGLATAQIIKFIFKDAFYLVGNYPTYSFDVLIQVGDKYETFIVRIRSNGRVAFLDSTWNFRDNNSSTVKHYDAVYFHGKTIRVADQGEAIIESLPENFLMSRTMSNIERERWINGETYYPSEKYGNRVHFLPNNSRFSILWEPYYIHISRQQLRTFYDRGELEINVYETDTNMTLTSIGLHFELVFIGDNAIKNLAPIMKEQLALPENQQR